MVSSRSRRRKIRSSSKLDAAQVAAGSGRACSKTTDCPSLQRTRNPSQRLEPQSLSRLVRRCSPLRRKETCVDFIRRSLEWIAHHEKIAAVARDRIPVDHVGLIALLESSDGLRAADCARVRRAEWSVRLPGAHAVVPFADALGRR